MCRRVLSLLLVATVLLSAGVGCIPSLAPRKSTVVHVVAVTWPGGAPPAVLSLYKAALEVTKATAGEYELKISVVSPTMPDPSAGPVTTPPTVTALEQALGQSPPPDVVLFSSSYEFGAAVERDLLAPLDDVARGDGSFNADDYFPGTLEAVSDQGKLYAIPLAAGPTVLMYDRRLFDAAGLGPPDATWTWSTLLNAAQRLTNPDAEGGPQWGLNTLSANWLPALIWQNGGELMTKDGRRSLLAEPAAVEAIKFYSDLLHVHKVAGLIPTRGGPGARAEMAIARAVPGGGPGEYPPLMGPAGRVAIQVMSGSSFAYGWPFGGLRSSGEQPMHLAVLPAGKQPATLIELQAALALTNASPNPKVAFRALNALAAQMQPEMTVPATRSAAARLAQVNPNIPEEDVPVLIAAMEHGRALPLYRQNEYMQVLYEKLIGPIQSGEKDPAELGRAAAEAMDEVLNKETVDPTDPTPVPPGAG